MRDNEKGFTLVELLVVVLIIGILTAIAVPHYTSSVERARATEAMNLVKSINEAVYSYAAGRTGEGTCPDSFRKLSISLPVVNDNVASIDLKNFRFALGGATGDIIPGTPCPGVTATRINGGKYDYVIWNPYRVRTSASTRSIALACYSPSNSADSLEVCKSLGLYKEGELPTT